MRDRIKSYVRETMKSYDVNDGKLAKELVSACYDEYEMQLSNGAGEEEAYAAAVANIEEIVKSKVSPRNKYAFALGMGRARAFYFGRRNAGFAPCKEYRILRRGDPRGMARLRRDNNSVSYIQTPQLPLA